MQKHIFAASILLLLTACGNEEDTKSAPIPALLNNTDYFNFCFKIDQLSFDAKCVGKDIKLNLKNARPGKTMDGQIVLFLYQNNEREVFLTTPPTSMNLEEISNLTWMTVSGVLTSRTQEEGINFVFTSAHQISAFTAPESAVEKAQMIDALESDRREKRIAEENFPTKTKRQTTDSAPSFSCANQTVTMRDFAAGNFINYYASKAISITNSSSGLRRQALNACLQCVRESFEDLRSARLYEDAQKTYDLGNKACLAVQEELALKYRSTYP